MKDVLITARGFIDTPEKWTKGLPAKDAEGFATSPHDAFAVCFCALGAIEKAARIVKKDHASQVCRFVGDVISKRLVDFNDNMNTTHADILEVFDKVIAAASES